MIRTKPTDRAQELRAALLRWYDANRRELPWRYPPGTTPDPYRVWLSEVMLQQTRVEAVKPYFARWLERFPTLEHLAAAPRDEVMKAWEGLGYYSRARNLHRAVREVAERYAGRVPDDATSFGQLPGVGRYTRGAVLSIAFGKEEPVVDGNVRRVFARWWDDPDPVERELWKLAEELVLGERPGDLNQALMELGATICTPRSPRCSACPVSAACAARAAGTQEERPLPRRAKPLPHEWTATAVIARDGELLLGRRRSEGRLGGLWEFPGSERREGEDPESGAVRTARELLGIEVGPVQSLCSVDHTFTHVKVTYDAVLCEHLSGEAEPLGYDELRWLPPERVAELALPRAQQRIAAMLLAGVGIIDSAAHRDE
jgi:A/G-specific adenine glycosylase